MNEQIWKTLATSLLTAIRILFLTTVSWDFFLTIVSKASQRALVLTGVGAQFAPYIIIPWAVAIFVLAVLLLFHLFNSDPAFVTHYGYYIYVVFIVLYVALGILAFINPLISWPLIFNFGVNALWSAAIIYFRFKMKNMPS